MLWLFCYFKAMAQTDSQEIECDGMIYVACQRELINEADGMSLCSSESIEVVQSSADVKEMAFPSLHTSVARSGSGVPEEQRADIIEVWCSCFCL